MRFIYSSPRVRNSSTNFCHSHGSCQVELIDIVRAAIVDRPPKKIQFPLPCCSFTSHLVPGATILVQVLEHIAMTFPCCRKTSPLTPGAALAPEPLQYLQVTTLHRTIQRSFLRNGRILPRAVLLPEPLNDFYVAAVAGSRKNPAIQLDPECILQPLQGLQLASPCCEEENARNKSEAKTNKKTLRKEDSPAYLAKAMAESNLSKGS